MGMTFIFSLYAFFLDPQSFVGQQGLAWFYLKYLNYIDGVLISA